ncbi:NHLP leader peptide family RiPP precursor [Paenibacillus harenae]|uniref:NHLP leader peptide family RiPP precursor n=1 Tax=Paenibacillus harenae TaxID=306543 RepID=UPI0003F9E747|nr:NHLP leader peptide family RiPP precursor [Paenibacillus harenae]
MATEMALKDQIIAKAWEDEAFKEKFLANPKAAVKEYFGIEFPESLEVEVVSETPSKVFFVIPPKPTELKTNGPKAAAMWE